MGEHTWTVDDYEAELHRLQQERKAVDLRLADLEAVVEAVREVVHTNACSDECGWFAFWQPRSPDEEAVFWPNRSNGHASEADAIKAFLKASRDREATSIPSTDSSSARIER